MTTSFDLKAALKKVCKNCKESTLKTYERNLRRLSKIAGFEVTPSTPSSEIKRASSPLLTNSRLMLSYQMLCP